ncbi:MAG: 3-oxoacyl-ACP reductase [Polyangiales bacterium]
MSDRLLQLSANPRMRAMVKSLGLPIPMPSPLSRAKDPIEARPLEDMRIAIAGNGELAHPLANGLARAGATMVPLYAAEEFEAAAEAFARPLGEDDGPLNGLIFDATGFSQPSDFRGIYDFFHERVSRLARSGRVVVVGPARLTSTDMVASGLTGFIKSLAKELGRRGSTANLILAPKGIGAHVEGSLRFFASRRSAFVTGQVLELSPSKGAAPREFTRSLDQKVALVTGAARGIGEACARRLAQEGAHVVCLDRPGEDRLFKVAADCGSALHVDVCDEDALDAIHDALGERGVDIVVHNAGVTRDRTLAKMKSENWDLVFDVNLDAPVSLTNGLMESKALRAGGRVIALSSVSGIAGNMGQTNYAASKAALAGWVRGNASALGRRRITLNAIAPGFIETRMTEAMPTAIREVARRLSALSQGGAPSDVADAVTFLATPAAAAVSGRLLRVCGGAFVGA